MTTTKAKKKRSAAAAVLGEKGSVSSLVMGSHESSSVSPDKEVKSKPVKAAAKKVASVRKSITFRTPITKETTHPRSHATRGVLATVFFKIGSFFGMIKRLGRLGLEKI